MITRFRLEAKGKTKHQVEISLGEAVDRLVEVAMRQADREVQTKVTDEVVSGTPGNYKGRIVVNVV